MRQTRVSIKDIWGNRMPHHSNWPVRVDEKLEEEPDKWVQYAFVLCSNCCGIVISVKDGKIVDVKGL